VTPAAVDIAGAESDEAIVVAPVAQKPAPNVEIPPEAVYHIVLSVTDGGSPPLTRYRRVLLRVPAAGMASDQLGCTDEQR
jgi:hypothetical protein